MASQMKPNSVGIPAHDPLLDDRRILYSSVQMMSEIFRVLSEKADLQPTDIVILFGLISASAPRNGEPQVIHDLDDDYHWISIMSLSQLVSINRTTLRRRVLVLQDRGFLSCDSSRGVRLTTGSMSDPSLHRVLAQEALKHLSRIQASIDRPNVQPRGGQNDHLQH